MPSPRTALLASRAAAVLVGLALPACGTDEMVVRVCGNVAVPGEIDALRIEILDDGFGRLRDGVLSLVPEDTGTVRRFPVTRALEAAEGPGWVRVVGLKDQVGVVQFDRQVSDLATVAEVDAVLEGQCLRATCALGQTCVAGTCVPAPREGEAPDCGGS